MIRRSGEVPTLRHSVTLAGDPRSLRWPDICVACAATATARRPVTRLFDRDWRRGHATRSPDDFRIVAVQTIDVPVCSACARQHDQEVQRPGAVRTVVSLVATIWVIPLGVAVLGVLLYFFPQLLGQAGALVAAPRTAWQAVGFAVAAIGSAWAAWYQTRRRRVSPPTSVTQAFDFSDNLAGLAAGEHRVYGMANDQFAAVFRHANADRVWTDARRAHGTRRETIVAALVAAVVLTALVIVLLR